MFDIKLIVWTRDKYSLPICPQKVTFASGGLKKSVGDENRVTPWGRSYRAGICNKVTTFSRSNGFGIRNKVTTWMGSNGIFSKWQWHTLYWPVLPGDRQIMWLLRPTNAYKPCDRYLQHSWSHIEPICGQRLSYLQSVTKTIGHYMQHLLITINYPGIK